ncbi:MAG: PilZ domain-containing protein [Planctomycetota bacterium]
MTRNTTRRFPDDRRVSKRVPVLFSAMLNRKGWRSQIAEVLDLSDTGAKVLLRFSLPVGAEVVLRVPGSKRKLGVPAVVANCAQDESHPVAGLRFHAPDDMRRELREIVDRVDRARRGPAAAKVAAVPGGTRRTTRTRRAGPEGKSLPPEGGVA